MDAAATERFGVPGVVLMENAGRNAVDAIEGVVGGVARKRMAVVAGAGNNGGDGFVVARHLAMRGAEVVTFLVAPPEKISGDALVNFRIIQNLGHDIRRTDSRPGGSIQLQNLGRELSGFDCVVDAAGGTGIAGALRGDIATAVEQINAASQIAAVAGRPSPRIIALDIPTGLDCDTGQAHGPTVFADVTVTFVARKKGFDSPGSARYTGQVIVADIGIPAEIILAARRNS